MWVIDIRHWLNESQDGPAVPRLKKQVHKLKEIIIFATSIKSNLLVKSSPKCGGMPGKKACNGQLEIRMNSDHEIYWICPICHFEGVVSGWKDLFCNVAGDDLKGGIH
jgi:hypothetical protein